MREYPSDLKVGMEFFDKTYKGQTIKQKTDKSVYSKNKNFVQCEEWINKSRCSHTMEFYLPRRRKGLLPWAMI